LGAILVAACGGSPSQSSDGDQVRSHEARTGHVSAADPSKKVWVARALARAKADLAQVTDYQGAPSAYGF
jgi:hypothetical protein